MDQRSSRRGTPWAPPEATPSAPLVDATILEFGQVIAGNYAGALLADLGATVIKVESPDGDPARNPAIAGIDGQSAIHLTVNRGKQSVVIDLKTDEGRAVFYRLVATADAVLDNFRPGVLERLGIGHATLRAHNPRIISASVTGYGNHGPDRDRPAFDLVVQAVSGHMSITGEPDRPPARVGIPLADLAAGLFTCVSVLAALLDRERTGRGRRIDVSMLDCMVSLLTYDATIFLNTGKQLPRSGSAHAHMVPWQAFRTADGYITVTAREEKFWRRLCEALGRLDLIDDPRARSNEARVANRAWVTAQLEQALAGRSTASWMEVFARYDLPAGPVNDFEHLFGEPHVVARNLVHAYNDPSSGEVRYVRSPAEIGGWAYPRLRPPRLGEHTVAVLRDRLGMGEAEIGDLLDGRAVVDGAGAPTAR